MLEQAFWAAHPALNMHRDMLTQIIAINAGDMVLDSVSALAAPYLVHGVEERTSPQGISGGMCCYLFMHTVQRLTNN